VREGKALYLKILSPTNRIKVSAIYAIGKNTVAFLIHLWMSFHTSQERPKSDWGLW